MQVYVQGLPWALGAWQIVDLPIGSTVTFSPAGSRAPRQRRLTDMLADADHWDSQVPVPAPPGNHYLALTEGRPAIFTVRAERRSNHRADIAALLQFEEASMTLCASKPQIRDAVYNGFHVNAVVAATEAISRLPVPPARVSPPKWILFLDLRDIFLPIRWILLDQDCISVQYLLRMYQDRHPDGFVLTITGAPIENGEVTELREPFFRVVNGHVLHFAFVADNASDSEDFGHGNFEEGQESEALSLADPVIQAEGRATLEAPAPDNDQVPNAPGDEDGIDVAAGLGSRQGSDNSPGGGSNGSFEAPLPIRVSFALLIPGFAPEAVFLTLEIPAQLDQVIGMLQAKRNPAHAVDFPVITPVSRQPDARWGVCVASTEWAPLNTTVCVDISLGEQRVFAALAPATADKWILLEVAGLPLSDDFDVYCDSTGPLRRTDVVELGLGSVICVVRHGQPKPWAMTLSEMLGTHLPWDDSPPLPADADTDRVCLACVDGVRVFPLLPHRAHLYREDIASRLHCPSMLLQLVPAQPRQSDTSFYGYPCRTVTAAINRGTFAADLQPVVALVDARRVYRGWMPCLANDGWVNLRQMLAQLEVNLPGHCMLRIRGYELAHEWTYVQEGTVLTVCVDSSGHPAPLGSCQASISEHIDDSEHEPGNCPDPGYSPGTTGGHRIGQEPGPNTDGPPPFEALGRVAMCSDCTTARCLDDGTSRRTPVLPEPQRSHDIASTRVGSPLCFLLPLLCIGACPSICIFWVPWLLFVAEASSRHAGRALFLGTLLLCLHPSRAMNAPLPWVQAQAPLSPALVHPGFNPSAGSNEAKGDLFRTFTGSWHASDMSGYSARIRCIPTPARALLRRTDGNESPRTDDLRTLLRDAAERPDCQAFFLAATLLEALTEHFAELQGPDVTSETPPAMLLDASRSTPCAICIDSLLGVDADLPRRIVTVNLSLAPKEASRYHELCIGSTPLGFRACDLVGLVRGRTSLNSWSEATDFEPLLTGVRVVDLQNFARQLRGQNSPDIWCFTDGSFYAAKATQPALLGWACLFLQPDTFSLSWAAGRVDPEFFGDRMLPSAFLSECIALMAAQLLSAIEFANVPVHFRSDCQAALSAMLGQAQGQHSTCAQAACNARTFRAQTSGRPDTYVHVAGHAGILGNEIADKLSKKAAKSKRLSHGLCRDADVLTLWLQDGAARLPWAGTAFQSLKDDPSMPPLNTPDLGDETEHAGLAASDLLAPFMPSYLKSFVPDEDDGNPGNDCEYKLALTVAALNVLSLLPPKLDGRPATSNEVGLAFQTGAPAILERQLHAHGVHVALLQEARTPEGTLKTGRYTRFCSSGVKGQWGIEVWIQDGAKILTDSQGQTWTLQVSRVTVLHTDPRRLLARINWGPVCFLVASLHGPHRVFERLHIQDWWLETHRLIKRFRKREYVLVGGDFNAAVGSQPTPHVGDLDPEPEDCAGEQMQVVAAEGDLFAPNTFATYHRGDSFTYYQKRSTCVLRTDYILLPTAWQVGSVESYTAPKIHAGHPSQDHVATCVDIDLTLVRPRARAEKGGRKIRASDVRDPANRDNIRDLLRSVPTVPWQTSSHAHAAIVTKHVQDGLQQILPRKASSPKHPYIRPITWQLQQTLARIRHVLHTRRRVFEPS